MLGGGCGVVVCAAVCAALGGMGGGLFVRGGCGLEIQAGGGIIVSAGGSGLRRVAHGSGVAAPVAVRRGRNGATGRRSGGHAAAGRQAGAVYRQRAGRAGRQVYAAVVGLPPARLAGGQQVAGVGAGQAGGRRSQSARAEPRGMGLIQRHRRNRLGRQGARAAGCGRRGHCRLARRGQPPLAGRADRRTRFFRRPRPDAGLEHR